MNKERERVNKVLNKLNNLELSEKSFEQKRNIEHEKDMIESMIKRLNA